MKTNNLNNILKTILFSLSVFLIEINNSFAAGDNGLKTTTSIKETVNNFTNNVLTSATTLLMTAAFVVFFYGVVRFIYDRSSGDDARLAKDKEAMLWGLLALFVMVSVWGIIKLVQGFFGIQNDNNIKVQSVQFLAPSSTGDTAVDPKGKLAVDKEDFSIKKYDPCTGGKDACGTDLVCQGAKGIAKTGEEGICITKEESNNKTFEKTNDGVISDNPFANQTTYPTIKVGAKSDLKSAAYSDGALALLFNLLKNKKCTTASYNGVNYDIGSTFGSTYDEADASFVKKFQQINGLPVDGVVGKSTWEALSVSTGQKTIFTGITVKDCK